MGIIVTVTPGVISFKKFAKRHVTKDKILATGKVILNICLVIIVAVHQSGLSNVKIGTIPCLLAQFYNKV